MKLHFEPNLDFQLQAIEAVCDLFRGQEVCRSEFTVTPDSTLPHVGPTFAEYDLGIGNRLALPDEKILENLKAIQLRHGLPPFRYPGFRGLQRGDGDRDRQNLCLPAHSL